MDDRLRHEEQPVPEGKVRVKSGEVVDRADVVFTLSQSDRDPNFFSAMDGTVYMKGLHGNLRTVHKPGKAGRKIMKAFLKQVAKERRQKAAEILKA